MTHLRKLAMMTMTLVRMTKTILISSFCSDDDDDDDDDDENVATMLIDLYFRIHVR